MKLRYPAIVILCLLLLLTARLAVVFQPELDWGLDPVAVNDVAKQLAASWGMIDGGSLPGSEYGMDYVVLDADGAFVAGTKRGLSESLTAAVANRDTVVDIESGGQVLGSLIIHNDLPVRWQALSDRMRTTLTVSVLMIGAFCLLYLLYLDRRVFRPFRKLEGFATAVAGGDLDAPLAMDRGNLFGAFTESFDLMREELGAARAREQAANRSKRELVASLSHDIKTPVASIQAVAEVMAVKTADEGQREGLQVISAKAEQISTLVNGLFQATLEELQQLPVTPVPQPSSLVGELVRRADHRGAASIGPIPACMIMADATRLEQILDNIITNAYKYAGTGLSVTTRLEEGFLVVSLRDFGRGLSREETALLFQKYYRGKNAEGVSGSGLGLYISRYLAEAMGGGLYAVHLGDGLELRLSLALAE